MSDNRCCPVDTPPSSEVYQPAGDNMYITGSRQSKTGVIYVGDIFGMIPINMRFPDMLADAGYLVVMPDFHGQQRWSPDNMPPNFESEEWKSFYATLRDTERHIPRAQSGVHLLRSMGCTKIISLGICWGAVVAFELAARHIVDGAATMHPSFFTPQHVAAVSTPVCVVLSMNEVDNGDMEAAVKNTSPHSVYRRYDLLEHGFSGARISPESLNVNERAQFDDAFKTLLSFLAI